MQVFLSLTCCVMIKFSCFTLITYSPFTIMSLGRFDIDKFSGKNDFGLWKVKMLAILTQQGLDDVVLDEANAFSDETAEQKKKIFNKARSTIFLSIDDKVLREVSKEETPAAVWKKLDSLYMTKSLANRLYLKQRLYTFKFTDERSVLDQLDEFSKSLDDLKNIGVKVEDEDKAIHLLNALPKSYSNLKDAMIYGRADSITLQGVQSAIKGKEIEKLSDQTSHDASGVGLLVKKDHPNKFAKKPPVHTKPAYKDRPYS